MNNEELSAEIQKSVEIALGRLHFTAIEQAARIDFLILENKALKKEIENLGENLTNTIA